MCTLRSMSYLSLEACLLDLEKQGQLLRIKEEVNPALEMAAIHLLVHEMQGPAILFENVKGTQYRCASNLFGTLARSEYIFRHSLQQVQQLIEIKNDPLKAIKSPIKNWRAGMAALKALPKKISSNVPVMYEEIKLSELPHIIHWEKDGGAFITMPQVYTEDIDKPGIMNANLGMYRIQLSGNEYILDKEVGLHYQLHRGIGVHQAKANQQGKPLKVSIFIGGPPSHPVSAVMPLPEGISEMTFAGLLGNKRFRYSYQDGYCLSADADFVITGEVYPGDVKPEGPFGDHLGYYSLTHPFPVMQVHKVYARKNAIWSFTVVGRPPQEDTSFGQLIHHMTGKALMHEIPGLKEVHAVDAAGVHPLLLAVGSERYTPYLDVARPAELLTLANHILGTGQLSLAKYLFITASQSQTISTHDIPAYFKYVLERVNLARDIHFHTHTTIDTLDYSGSNINAGSKVVVAAYGPPLRNLGTTIPAFLTKNAKLVMPGVLAISFPAFTEYHQATIEVEHWANSCLPHSIELNSFPLVVLCDDAEFVAASISNFLWVTFTRSNPSHDIYGIDSSTEFKHWGCKVALVIDARAKPHHAPALEMNPALKQRAIQILQRAGFFSEAKHSTTM